MKGFEKKVVLSEDFIFTAFLLAGFVILTFHILDWPPKSRTLPLITCVFASLLLAGQIVNMLLRKSERGEGKKRLPGKVVAGFLAVGVMIALAYVIGLPIAVGLMGVALAWIFGERRWWVILLIGISSLLLMYFLFGKVFGLPMEF